MDWRPIHWLKFVYAIIGSGEIGTAGQLFVELTDLQITASTVCNQSPFEYDPSDADAYEYILSCEEARRQLQQTD